MRLSTWPRFLPPALLLAFACHSSVAPSGDNGAPAPGDDTASIPFKGETLVFPPPQTRRDRRALPRHMAEVEDAAGEEIQVAHPELDSDDHFEFSGDTVRVRFSRKVAGVDVDKDVPPIEITPAVDGKARWTSPYSLAFTAEKPFDPDTTYTLKVGEVTDEDGHELEAWSATFRADPQLWIAGKLISYLPKPGRPRVVAIRQGSELKVGVRPKIEILFDQPVKAKHITGYMTLTDDTKKTAVDTVVHVSQGRTFDGARVDPGHVATVAARGRLEPGHDYTLKIDDAYSEEFISLEVAERLKFSEVNCGWRSEDCTWKSGTLQTQGREFTVEFNNRLDNTDGRIRKALEISPPVKNLSVWVDRWSDSGKVQIAGAFKPSTTYTVRLAEARDAFGWSLPAPVEFKVKTAPMSASASMPEGVQYLDAQRSRAYAVSSRNVAKLALKLWEVEDKQEAWREANRSVSSRETPSGFPDVIIDVEPHPRRDKQVTTKVDLLKHLSAGKTYVAALVFEDRDVAFKAPRPSYPSWSWASKPPISLVTVNDDKAIVLHARSGPQDTLVHVSRLGAGDPLSGAKFFLDGKRVKGVTSDATGVARLPLALEDAREKLLTVEHDGSRGVLVLGQSVQTDGDLVPELSAGATGAIDKIRGLVISDRGVYRPGATMHFKAMLRTPHGSELSAVAFAPVRLEVTAPNGKTAFEASGMTNDAGAFSGSWTMGDGVEIGRYHATIEPATGEGAFASTQVQVAEFETPRFKVDVEAKAADNKLAAVVEGRYLFGATMDGADVTWTVRRAAASLPSGALAARGLTFRRYRDYGSPWSQTGEGVLDAKGQLQVSPALELDADAGPQRFTLEAEVTDDSHRAIAGRDSVVVHTAAHYAGVRLDERWPDVGKALPLELGVVDQAGKAVAGKKIEARLVRLSWKRTRRPGPGGSVRVQWHEVEKTVDRCNAVSGSSVVSCALTPKRSGTYEVRTSTTGKPGGSVRLWAYGSGYASTEPTPGHRVELLADKNAYAPGDTAKVMVRSPFDKATAIFTVEQGALVKTETKTVSSGATEFSVPLAAEHAPHVHATVTLLPIGAQGDAIADWKFGATKLPVALEGMQLGIGIVSDKPFYAPGEKAALTVKVERGGKPVENADVALAVVDEGVLRLTNFHAADPVKALRPGAALRFSISDTRRSLAEMLERSAVAGDGAGDDGSASLVSTRKNFVRTALWEPDLRTDEDGEVSVDLELPDNLTEFRMMAVVLDGSGRGGNAESSFEVRKPLMIIPAVPRFALAGDTYEAAVMVHNGKEEATTATVKLGDRSRTVELAARGHERVAFDMKPKRAGLSKLTFSVADDGGTVRDKVEAKVPVQSPGIDERPRLSGSFHQVQEVLLEVPDGVTTDLRKDAKVVVTVGPSVWPELGARLEYLVDYPHGCVEQTTSSTLPLLAAKDILPRLGFFRYSKKDIDTMTAAGIKRLASMKTSSGGLAYWPGGYDPNVYGTAYAMRAVSLAAKQGIEEPGLLDGMAQFLQNHLVSDTGSRTRDAEVQASIALALSEADKLPESSADMLYDTAANQGVFGLANLALALSTLPGQQERVSDLLDRIEASFDPYGQLVAQSPEGEFYYYGSTTRTKSQAALALVRLRPQAKVIPTLVADLARATEGYTTQSTAFALLALREHIVSLDVVDASAVARLDGVQLTPEEDGTNAMGPGAARFEIPYAQVAGRRGLLRLESNADVAVSFLVEAKWRRPLDGEGSLVATSALRGPEMYRVYTNAKGEEIDLERVAPGQVIRVALLGRLPDIESDRRGYLAMTDRLPAGFEPIQPDLWTVARLPELSDKHPMADTLRWGSAEASHVELRDDRVHMYFDRIWGEYVAGTYLMRATTPGHYTVPPAMGELMYEPDSTGYTKALELTVTR